MCPQFLRNSKKIHRTFPGIKIGNSFENLLMRFAVKALRFQDVENGYTASLSSIIAPRTASSISFACGGTLPKSGKAAIVGFWLFLCFAINVKYCYLINYNAMEIIIPQAPKVGISQFVEIKGLVFVTNNIC
jgi:hypothetical protein